jgi:AcrR family transcriptional regulator
VPASPAESPRERRRAEELARRREDAIAAASAVFAEKGFHAAQMTEIAARAELARATLYSLFGGKDELYAEVIATTAGAVRDAVREKVEAVRDPAERLLSLVDSLFACWEENQDLFRIYARGTHGLPWKIREAMGESALHLFREFTVWVEGLAADAQRAGCLRGLDPEALSLALVGAITTTATHSIETTPDRPLTAAAPAVRAIFERLVAEPQQP